MSPSKAGGSFLSGQRSPWRYLGNSPDGGTHLALRRLGIGSRSWLPTASTGWSTAIAQRARAIALQSVTVGMGLLLAAMVAALAGTLPPAVGALLQKRSTWR